MSVVVVARALVSLSALLLAGAGAACERDREPKMSATGPGVEQYGGYYDYCVEYGGDVELHCSFGDMGNLTILRASVLTEFYNKYVTTNYAKDLPTKVVNKTTVTSLLKPTIGKYKYTCKDSKSECESFLLIHHQPAMHISSPRVQVKLNDYRYIGHHYFVPIGDNYQITCTGGENETLHIYISYNIVPHDIENDTSVAYRARADHPREFDYIRCEAQNDAIQYIRLTLDFFPEAHNFSCISYDGNEVICSWSPSSNETTFKLFYSAEAEADSKLLCLGMSSIVSSCTWERLVELDFHLLMQTCNNFICNNQSFTLNFNAIKKSSPVTISFVKLTSPREAYMVWEHEWYPGKLCSHKVEYRLSAFGEKWRQVDTSSVQCYDDEVCEFQLALPYPSSEYEVRVYTRLKTATDERLWSDPASVSIVTKPLEECACETGNNGTSESSTPHDAACEACQLKDHVVNVNTALSKLKIRMRQKLAKIKLFGQFHKDLESVPSS